jgi:hypothetical protein
VKWLRDDPGGARADPAQVATEQAALEFLAAIGFPHAPRLIAADRDAGVLALEDLAPREPLSALLRARPPAALARERLAFARVTGALNAATAGKSAAYERLRGRFGDFDPLAGRTHGLGPTWRATEDDLSALGLARSHAVEHDIEVVIATLRHPGPFLAFSNGDCEANNFLVAEVGGGVDGRLIDFEFASYRHALTCATWMHVPGPAWITVGDPLCADLENAYRRALSPAIAESEDDRLFGSGLAAACLALALDRLRRFRTLDQRQRGDQSRVQLVSTLESAAAAARRHRALPGLAGWAERVAAWLRRRWPDADVDLARCGAYMPRG